MGGDIMQMSITTIDSPEEVISIPYLVGDEESRELLEDFARTVNGTGRSDTFSVSKRVFSTTHKMLDPTEWRKIFNYMDSTMWKPCNLYFEHLGGSITAKIQIRSTRQRGKRLTSFSTDLRDLTIDV